ncbi:ICMT-domain-containing protein [Aureobasidium melanogenum CBS 110374]|uniref:Protein-S-isoprenylcysteine O-methyltransferase n=1 Tax=Aureobasidium melanogenum (strain CBS 110374) TaxID=1043003 RepID=A0A074VFF5_AURM1|nr:ICMT-domain-containing protein [Aureobasidium melanogenum CBS 110374]KEQ57709.1 ICMT-domain-containing protein [Aureobasidium melanogenum CBS 110374]
MTHSAHLLSGIASRAFLLGILCAICSTTAVLLGIQDCQWWRLPNSSSIDIESFLLSTHAYMFAHLCALSEIHARFIIPHTIVGGALMTILGQVIRTSAMMQAGPSFNHQIESRGREDHELITTGLYSWSRHPSYIGLYLLFVGTQFMVGNKFAALFLAYVLWNLPSVEEDCLVNIFGLEYHAYTKQVSGCPFV